jgi:hypothetical protein
MTTWHPLSANVGTNFDGKRRQLVQFDCGLKQQSSVLVVTVAVAVAVAVAV